VPEFRIEWRAHEREYNCLGDAQRSPGAQPLGYGAPPVAMIFLVLGPQPREQVAQLSLTNPRDALHHDKRQHFKTRNHNHAPFVKEVT